MHTDRFYKLIIHNGFLMIFVTQMFYSHFIYLIFKSLLILWLYYFILFKNFNHLNMLILIIIFF